MSIILYGPSLALSQVTGLDSKKNLLMYYVTWIFFKVWLAIISCGAICTFYTSIVRFVLYFMQWNTFSFEGWYESGNLGGCSTIIYYNPWCSSLHCLW
jgi:hypothetical protein